MSNKKEQEMKKMLEGSAVNFGLLQRTVEPGGAPASPPPVEAKQEEVKKEKGSTPPAKKPVQAAKPQAKTPKTGNAGVSGKPDEKEGEADTNPYGYAAGPTWPLVGYEKPFLIPMPEAQGRGGAALTVRIPLELNVTVDAHIARLGVKNLSEWIRHAIERQLSAEQKELAKK